MRCRAIGYFSHYTLTMQALRALRGVKLRRGHVNRRDANGRSLYTAVASFLETHRRTDARRHPWCQPPTQPAPSNVTIFTNSLLDYCGAPPTQIGQARAA